jgi:hypothetical protein
MNAVGRGAQMSRELFITHSIALGEKVITPHPDEITFARFMEIGRESATYFYRSQDSKEGFMAGWLAIGQQLSETIRNGPLNVKEEHRDAVQSMPSNILLFKQREGNNDETMDN